VYNINNDLANKLPANTNAKLFAGNLSISPQGTSSEGGELRLDACSKSKNISGICIDNYNGLLRFIGIDSADGTSKVNGASTHMEIDLYNKGIWGGYYFDGTSEYCNKFTNPVSITIGNQTCYLDGSSNIAFDISNGFGAFGNVICCEYTYRVQNLTPNIDKPIICTPVITEGLSLRGVQLGIMTSCVPSIDWNTRLVTNAPINNTGNMIVRAIGEVTQDYTITILWIVNSQIAYS